MINVKDVLTATAVVIERIPGNKSLSDNVNPLIKGLNAASISLEGYTLDNIATKLPDETKEDSEHTVLLNQSATKIATVIRESLNVIKTHVVPACDIIEKNIRKIGSSESIIDMVLNKLFLNFYHIPNAFFESPIFPTEPDALYANNLLFSSKNLTELGEWPEKNYDEIRAILSDAEKYPELQPALQDKDAVTTAWETLKGKKYWLGLMDNNVNPKTCDISIRHINALIILTLLITKFSNDENPFPGVTDIGLEDYRAKLIKAKAFLNTVLYYTKVRLNRHLTNGLVLDNSDVKYEKCDIKESQFFGSMVLNGGSFVIYNDTLAEYFSNSDTYSLSSIVIGMFYAKLSGKRIPEGDFLSLLPFYKESQIEYTERLKTACIVNCKNTAAEYIRIALTDIANSELWKPFLSEDGKYKNVYYRLDDLIKQQGGITQHLLFPSTLDAIRNGDIHVANTLVAPVIADVLGAPIASEILRNNIHKEAVSLERQRKLAGKAVAKVIIDKLIN